MRRFFRLIVLPTLLLWFTACGGNSHNTSSTSTGTTGGNGSSSGSNGSGSNGSSNGSGGSSASTAALAYAVSGNAIDGVRVDSTGAATATTGSPYSAPNTFSLALQNNILEASGQGGLEGSAPTSIAAYKADANGVLTQSSTTPVQGRTFLAFDKSGKYLYASADGIPYPAQQTKLPGILGWTVDQSTGALTPIPGSGWLLEQGETSADAITVAPNGSAVCLVVSDPHGSGGVECFARNSDGSINAMSRLGTLAGADSTMDVAISSDSQFTYGAGGVANVVYYGPINNPGGAQAPSVPSGGNNAVSIAADPAGNWLAVANQGSNKVVIFSIGANGAPTAGAPTSLPAAPNAVRFSQSGKYLFVSTNAGIVAFSFDGSKGTLTQASGSPVGSSDGLLAAQ
jgi:Lactonase, 7-bladed beta-propeller